MPRDRQVWTSDLVTAEEAAKRLNMAQLALLNLAGRRRSNFPEPVCGKGAKSVWIWTDILAWWEVEHAASVEVKRVAADDERNRGVHNNRRRKVA